MIDEHGGQLFDRDTKELMIGCAVSCTVAAAPAALIPN
jgi:hypothetical protein